MVLLVSMMSLVRAFSVSLVDLGRHLLGAQCPLVVVVGPTFCNNY